MVLIILAGWREGLQKVALTTLQREMLQLSLKEAKANTDRLLESEEDALRLENPITLQVPTEVAAEFISRATKLGALVGFAMAALPGPLAPASPARQAA